jgi:hypothetical protein
LIHKPPSPGLTAQRSTFHNSTGHNDDDKTNAQVLHNGLYSQQHFSPFRDIKKKKKKKRKLSTFCDVRRLFSFLFFLMITLIFQQQKRERESDVPCDVSLH